MWHYLMLWPDNVCVNELHSDQVLPLKASSLLTMTYHVAICPHLTRSHRGRTTRQ